MCSDTSSAHWKTGSLLVSDVPWVNASGSGEGGGGGGQDPFPNTLPASWWHNLYIMHWFVLIWLPHSPPPPLPIVELICICSQSYAMCSIYYLWNEARMRILLLSQSLPTVTSTILQPMCVGSISRASAS